MHHLPVLLVNGSDKQDAVGGPSVEGCGVPPSQEGNPTKTRHRERGVLASYLRIEERVPYRLRGCAEPE